MRVNGQPPPMHGDFARSRLKISIALWLNPVSLDAICRACYLRPLRLFLSRMVSGSRE